LFVAALKPSDIRTLEEVPAPTDEERLRVEPIQIGFGAAVATIAPAMTVMVIDWELLHP
jgi:hypothetical protein